MSIICPVKGCGYVAKTKPALVAHEKFIHQTPNAPVPAQPEPAKVIPLAPKRAVKLRERIAKGKVMHGTSPGPKRPMTEAARTKALAATRVMGKPVELVTLVGVRNDDRTREDWLLRAVEKMRPDFAAVGRTVPPVRISIGWPGGRTARLDPLGQCWAAGAVADGIAAIFITPSQDDPIQILATTRHEMVHAAGEMHHRAGFRKLAREVGFDPKPGASGTSSTFRTLELDFKLKALYADLGPFPHAKVSKGLLDGRPKVQGTRMIKLVCPEDEYSVRTTQKWIDVGMPSCPDGHEMEVAE